MNQLLMIISPQSFARSLLPLPRKRQEIVSYKSPVSTGVVPFSLVKKSEECKDKWAEALQVVAQRYGVVPDKNTCTTVARVPPSTVFTRKYWKVNHIEAMGALLEEAKTQLGKLTDEVENNPRWLSPGGKSNDLEQLAFSAGYINRALEAQSKALSLYNSQPSASEETLDREKEGLENAIQEIKAFDKSIYIKSTPGYDIFNVVGGAISAVVSSIAFCLVSVPAAIFVLNSIQLLITCLQNGLSLKTEAVKQNTAVNNKIKGVFTPLIKSLDKIIMDPVEQAVKAATAEMQPVAQKIQQDMQAGAQYLASIHEQVKNLSLQQPQQAGGVSGVNGVEMSVEEWNALKDVLKDRFSTAASNFYAELAEIEDEAGKRIKLSPQERTQVISLLAAKGLGSHKVYGKAVTAFIPELTVSPEKKQQIKEALAFTSEEGQPYWDALIKLKAHYEAAKVKPEKINTRITSQINKAVTQISSSDSNVVSYIG